MKLPKITSQQQFNEYKEQRAYIGALGQRFDTDGRIRSLNMRILEWLDEQERVANPAKPVAIKPKPKPVAKPNPAPAAEQPKITEDQNADAHRAYLEKYMQGLRERLQRK